MRRRSIDQIIGANAVALPLNRQRKMRRGKRETETTRAENSRVSVLC